MNDTTLLTVFIAVTAVAVVLQMLILAGMYFAMCKMMGRTEAVQQRVNDQLLPLVEKVRALVDESTPKLQAVVTNVTETSSLIRSQADKIDVTITEILTVARRQAGKADVLATRTLERVDTTASVLQNAVTSPLRRLSGLVEGIAAGVSQFAGGRNEQRQGKPGASKEKAAPSDNLFI